MRGVCVAEDCRDAIRRRHHWSRPATRDDPKALTAGQRQEVERLSGQYQFFHWHLAFPEVFAKGGFDCVLGNPPWDKIQPEEQKFFASLQPEIADQGNAKIRKERIKALETTTQ